MCLAKVAGVGQQIWRKTSGRLADGLAQAAGYDHAVDYGGQILKIGEYSKSAVARASAKRDAADLQVSTQARLMAEQKRTMPFVQPVATPRVGGLQIKGGY